MTPDPLDGFIHYFINKGVITSEFDSAKMELQTILEEDVVIREAYRAYIEFMSANPMFAIGVIREIVPVIRLVLVEAFENALRNRRR